MRLYFGCLLGCLLLLLGSCTPEKKQDNVPVIGFMDAFEDETLYKARDGFYDALKAQGYSEEAATVRIIYRNAQGSIPTLTQISQYFVSEKVALIATNPTLSTITAVNRTKEIPVFQMVTSEPSLIGLTDKQGYPPKNLFGTMENLAYIDTSFTLIPKLIQPKGSRLVVGMIYNQAEPQSVDAVERITQLAASLNITIEALPVNQSSEAQMVTRALINRNIDAFFANPDNTVFAAFETIVQTCDKANIPIFTSEAGLVARGAVAAYGADLYQWGYQTGLQAAQYLKTKSTEGLTLSYVQQRNHVYNKKVAERYQLTVPATYLPIE